MSDALDAAFAQPHTAAPEPIMPKETVGGAVRQMGEAAKVGGRTFLDVMGQPSWASQKLRRATVREPAFGGELAPPTFHERMAIVDPVVWGAGVAENLARLPSAIGAGARAMGWGPLEAAVAEQAPFLVGPASRAAKTLYQLRRPPPIIDPSNVRGYPVPMLPPGRGPMLELPPGPTRALPPGPRGPLPIAATATPDVPVFWPTPVVPPSLPTRQQGQLPGRLYTPQLPPPRLGENLRRRTYFPERTPYQPERPLEVKGGVREGELLDRFGRPIPKEEVPAPTMPERERLRTLYKGRLGQGAKTELERLEGRMQDTVLEGGGKFRGIQSIRGRPMYVVFDDPAAPASQASTMYLPIDEATPQGIRRKIADKRGQYAASEPATKPEVKPAETPVTPPPPAPPRITFEEPRQTGSVKGGASTIADQRNRVFVDGYLSGEKGLEETVREVETKYPTLKGWEVETYLNGQADGRAKELFRIKNMGAEKLLEERRAAAATKPPFVEKTKIGAQAMIGGTEARAIPTSRLQSQVPQSKLSESPLFSKPATETQVEIPAEPKPYAGQHYGKTVDLGTVHLNDAEEVRILIRDHGGISPKSIGLDLQATPKEFLREGGRPFDELVQEIADAQGKRPRDVERELNHTFARYSTLRAELKNEGLMTEIRAAKPPEDIHVSPEEWQQMGPSDRRGAIEWFRDVFSDESGRLNVDAMVNAWKKFRRRLPMEEAVRGVVPDSPVISEVERWNVGLADGIKAVASAPWWKAIRKMNPETLKDIDEALVNDWLGRLSPALRARMQAPDVTLTAPEIAALQTARNQAIAAQAPADLRAAMQRRDVQFGRENQSRTFFGLPPIPEEYGPYVPRITDKEAREAVSLGGGRLGVGRGLQTTVRGHQQERVFQTYRQGESAGIEYEDPRNALIMREWEGLKLRATHRLFRDLEAKGVLFKDRTAATAASPIGKPWRVENAPGGTWWARTEQEARFLEQNLTESTKGPTGSFVHYGNQLIRNPSLVNPFPHIVKNMWAKYLLARGRMNTFGLARDTVEYFRETNPALLREFKDAMPFSSSGRTAGELLGNELRRAPVGEALRLAGRALGLLNRPSSKVIFEWADPAMRYSLFKHYRGKGMSPYEAANHAWVDLIRYGTRSDLVDTWKAWPMNFFVPWRYGTLVSLLKQVKNHPIRTALLVAGVDYLREMRYRSAGKWTHLPWDYTENPLAIVLQNALDGDKSARQQAGEAFGVVATTRIFGPGGAFAAGQLVDTLNDMRGRGDWERTKNMFWGISQLYNLHKEWDQFQQTGDVKYLAEMVPTIMLGEHLATTYQPRRLMRDLPEWLPGMQRSPLVQDAEALQAQRDERARRYREHRQERPAPSIEDKLRAGGYLR